MICGEDFNTAYGDVIDNAYMRMFVDRINSHLQDAFDYLAPVRDNIQSTLTYKNQLKALNETLPEDYKMIVIGVMLFLIFFVIIMLLI